MADRAPASNQPLSPQLADAAKPKKNADGSLALYIQRDSLGWLPAPDGPIYLAMRLDCSKNRAAFRPAAARREPAAAVGSTHRAVNLLSHDTALDQ
jgi:hypothetical protein